MACITPFSMKHKSTGESMSFPCGKCPPCLKRRVSQWSFRLLQEDKRSSSAFFVTLTYEVPPLSGRNFMTLSKYDFQCFMKRLRKITTAAYCGKCKRSGVVPAIKYFAVGEYGGKTLRPHFHAIIFNSTEADIVAAWSLGGKPIGHLHFGGVTGASIGYSLKYMMKPGKIPMHANDDRVPEFQLMSKGLGENYCSESMNRWHLADLENRMYCNVDGKKIAMPRYYKDRIYTQSEREVIAYYARLNSDKVNDEIAKAWFDKYGPRWPLFKFQADRYVFEKMYRDALKDRTKV